MAATISAALKSYLEKQGFQLSVYKDAVPSGTPSPAKGPLYKPYITVDERIALTLDPRGDGGLAKPRAIFGDELDGVADVAAKTVHDDRFRNTNALSLVQGLMPTNAPDNLVSNGDFELYAGGWATVHDDRLYTLNALTLASSGAGALAANILTLGSGTGYSFGNPDWEDGNLTIRFKHITGSGFGLHWHCSGSRAAQLGAQANDVGCYVDPGTLYMGKRLAGVWQSQVAIAIPGGLVNGTWYWLRISSTGTTYTSTVFADNAGAIGAQIVTQNTVYADAVLASGWAGLRDYAGGAGIQVGGAFVGVLVVQAPVPNGYGIYPFIGSAYDPTSIAWSRSNPWNGSARCVSIYCPTINSWAFVQAGWQATNGVNCTAAVRVKGPVGQSAIGILEPFGGVPSIGDFTTPSVALTGAWQRVSFTFTPGATALTNIRVQPGSGGSGLAGMYYFDELMVYPTANPNSFLDMGGFTNLMFGHPDWTDGTFAVRFRPDGDGLSQSHECSPLIWWHCSDARGIYPQNAYYVSANLSYDSRLTIGKLIGGVDTQLLLSPGNLFADGLSFGTWWWLEISTVGSTITATVYRDNAGAKGTVLRSITVVDGSLASGYAGIGNGWSGAILWGGDYPGVCTVTTPAPRGWAYQSQQGNTDVTSGAWSSARSYGGAKSLGIYYPTANSYGYWYATSPALVIPGDPHTASFWEYAPTSATMAGAMLVHDAGPNDWFGPQTTLANQWTQQSLAFTPGAGGAQTNVYLRPDNGGGAVAGLYYFDRYQLVTPNKNTGKELVQLNLWTGWRDTDDHTVEPVGLADQITERLDGTRLDVSGSGMPPKLVYDVAVRNSLRRVDRDANLVHVAYTLEIRREV